MRDRDHRRSLKRRAEMEEGVKEQKKVGGSLFAFRKSDRLKEHGAMLMFYPISGV